MQPAARPPAPPRRGPAVVALVLVGLVVALVVGLRIAWSQLLHSDSLRAEIEESASEPLARLYPGARVRIGAIEPYGLIGAKLSGIDLVLGPGASGKTQKVPPLTVKVHAGPGVFFSKLPRIGFEVESPGDGSRDVVTGAVVLARATGDLVQLDARLDECDLAQWLRPKGIRTLVLTGRASVSGKGKPLTFAGRIVNLSASLDLPGVAALPASIKAAVRTFSVFRDAELSATMTATRFDLVKPLVLANQGGKVKVQGGMLLAKEPPAWAARVDLEMPPAVAAIVAKGLLRCRVGPAPGALSFQMSGPWEGPQCR